MATYTVTDIKIVFQPRLCAPPPRAYLLRNPTSTVRARTVRDPGPGTQALIKTQRGE